ncbi:MAG: DUF5615 family PIN-like protein [Fimbriimonadia bacterium]|nr:DUF5615 family PIN-like protein [Fimbriimonadia bacterium]
MRILIDECIDWRLRRYFSETVEVATVKEMGWSGIKNGQLLRLAEQHFDVVLTADKNLPKQHDVTQMKIALVIIIARDNRLQSHVQLIANIESTAHTARKGQVSWVKILIVNSFFLTLR